MVNPLYKWNGKGLDSCVPAYVGSLTLFTLTHPYPLRVSLAFLASPPNAQGCMLPSKSFKRIIGPSLCISGSPCAAPKHRRTACQITKRWPINSCRIVASALWVLHVHHLSSPCLIGALFVALDAQVCSLPTICMRTNGSSYALLVHLVPPLYTQVYCLPDNYEVVDRSLDDVRHVLDPRFTPADVAKLDKFHKKGKNWPETAKGKAGYFNHP
eukprot:scaffold92598_cov18-Tisochrysis_lutea.AAC.1